MLPSTLEATELNDQLSDLEKQVRTIERRFEMDKVIYSAEMVSNRLKENKAPATKKDASSNVLYEFIDKYIMDHEATREAGILIVYKSLKTHLQDYQQVTKKKITFENIDYSFFQSFQNFHIEKPKYFPGKNGLNNTTVAKQLSTIKTFLNYARKQRIKTSDGYRDFKIKRESLEVIALTNEEFKTLFYLDPSGNKRLAQVRDVFCFACTTGLRYSDLNQLKREHIKGDEIRLTTKKTKENHTIPLTPYSKAILAKYEAMHRPLPVISNQKLNTFAPSGCKRTS